MVIQHSLYPSSLGQVSLSPCPPSLFAMLWLMPSTVFGAVMSGSGVHPYTYTRKDLHNNYCTQSY